MIRTKVLDGYTADYLHKVRNPVTRFALKYKEDAVVDYPNLALNRYLEKLSNFLP